MPLLITFCFLAVAQIGKLESELVRLQTSEWDAEQLRDEVAKLREQVMMR